MLYEFAITPDVFDPSIHETNPALSVTVVELLRGICDNGLVANLHRAAWSRHVREQRIGDLPQDLRDRIIACLEMLDRRQRLVRHPRGTAGDIPSDQEWLTLALNSHNLLAFHGIVLSEPLFRTARCNGAHFLELSTVLNSPQWLGRQRSLDVHKTQAEYRQTLAPVLRYTKSLSLVDPFFNAHEAKYTDMLRLCSELTGRPRHDRTHARIDIHADFDKQKPDDADETALTNLWRHVLQPLADQDGHRFRVFLWRARAGGRAFHDRYLITNQCAISTPHGLDIERRATPSLTTWSLLEEHIRLRSLEDYDPATSPYLLTLDFEVA